MRISFAAPRVTEKGALVLLLGKGARLSTDLKAIDKSTKGAISRAIKAADFDGAKGKAVTIPGPEGVKASHILLLGVGDGKKLAKSDAEKLGGGLWPRLVATGAGSASVLVDGVTGLKDAAVTASAIAVGLGLKSYRFTKYLSEGKDKNAGPKAIVMLTEKTAAARKLYSPQAKVIDGVHLTRDLVSEPPNILYPAELAKRAKALTKLGVKVEVLNEKKMRELGMGALLGVGQGSVRESQLVVMQWQGAAKKSDAPVALVGKGVCFDTGGISLKPSGGMWDMKMDMGGAAAVVGAMAALAGRKAKVNVVGVIGCVENMPDGNAQRPADVVTAMNGTTIEVLNTDAEGRLVLADALWYTQDRFKPQVMIDFATLTGAIIVALAHEYAGVFSNDDKVAKALTDAGAASGDRAWQLPIGKEFTARLKSAVADLANISRAPAGGSITAACFLEKFVNDVPWAHIDIAGAAWRDDTTALAPSGANRLWRASGRSVGF